jgi:hypothetical protein
LDVPVLHHQGCLEVVRHRSDLSHSE